VLYQPPQATARSSPVATPVLAKQSLAICSTRETALPRQRRGTPHPADGSADGAERTLVQQSQCDDSGEAVGGHKVEALAERAAGVLLHAPRRSAVCPSARARCAAAAVNT
jgi:hypothetical protein